MSLRKLAFVVVAIMLAAPPARADVALGLFVGDPTAVDLKLGLDRVSALDLAFGVSQFYDRYGYYGHATYLARIAEARGNSVIVPVRLGIGVALIDGHDYGLSLGARAPIEIGFRFRRTPLELYLEAALLLVFLDPAPSYVYLQGQGGIGLRVYL
jgi:hypothetical protein